MVNVANSISDFTLRLNPSAENIATQANEENLATGGNNRFSSMAGGNVRQSLDTNQLLTQEEEGPSLNNNVIGVEN